MNCKALKTVSYESLLEAHWEDEPSNKYRFDLKLKFRPNELTVVDFLQVFSQFNVQLLEMSIKHTDDGLVYVDFSLQIDNPAKISFVLKDLKKFSVSIEVLKKVIS
jgi:(p)ppGpp synthase/HD superfamily hydrolase